MTSGLKLRVVCSNGSQSTSSGGDRGAGARENSRREAGEERVEAGVLRRR